MDEAEKAEKAEKNVNATRRLHNSREISAIYLAPTRKFDIWYF